MRPWKKCTQRSKSRAGKSDEKPRGIVRGFRSLYLGSRRNFAAMAPTEDGPHTQDIGALVRAVTQEGATDIQFHELGLRHTEGRNELFST